MAASSCNGRTRKRHMHTAQTTIDKDALHEPLFREANEIYEDCSTHPAFPALRSFNRRFSSRPLTRSELLPGQHGDVQSSHYWRNCDSRRKVVGPDSAPSS